MTAPPQRLPAEASLAALLAPACADRVADGDGPGAAAAPPDAGSAAPVSSGGGAASRPPSLPAAESPLAEEERRCAGPEDCTWVRRTCCPAPRTTAELLWAARRDAAVAVESRREVACAAELAESCGPEVSLDPNLGLACTAGRCEVLSVDSRPDVSGCTRDLDCYGFPKYWQAKCLGPSQVVAISDWEAYLRLVCNQSPMSSNLFLCPGEDPSAAHLFGYCEDARRVLRPGPGAPSP